MTLQLSYGLAILIFGQLPTIEAKGFDAALQKDTLLATVRISNPKKNTIGVGVLLHRSGSTAYILTAAHVVEDTENVDVDVYGAKSYPNPSKTYRSLRVIARGKDRQPDLAVVKLVGFTGESAGLKLCPLKGGPKDKKFYALASGCGEKLAPTLRQLTVQDKVKAKRPNEDRAGTYFLIMEKPVGGQSGGPLIDSNGQLLGICSGANGEHGYFCHFDDIHAFLTANGLGSVIKVKP